MITETTVKRCANCHEPTQCRIIMQDGIRKGVAYPVCSTCIEAIDKAPPMTLEEQRHRLVTERAKLLDEPDSPIKERLLRWCAQFIDEIDVNLNGEVTAE